MTTKNIAASDSSTVTRRPAAQKTKENTVRKLILPLCGLGLLLVGFGLGGLIAHKLDNPVVAAVNGKVIKLNELDHRCEIASGSVAMSNLMKESLQQQFYVSEGAWPTEDEIDAKLTKDEQQPGFIDGLAQNHETVGDFRSALALQLAQNNLVTRGVTATDADALAFYKANIDPNNPQAQYYRPEVVRVAVIITKTTQQQDAAVQDLNIGETFDQVARLYSSGSNAANGGVLPPIRRGEPALNKYPGLQPILFAMKPGQQIDHIKIDGAYWIIRCLAHAAATTVPYAQVEDDCKTGAAVTKGVALNGASVQAAYANYRQAAKLQIFRQGYQFLLQKLGTAG